MPVADGYEEQCLAIFILSISVNIKSFPEYFPNSFVPIVDFIEKQYLAIFIRSIGIDIQSYH